MEKKPVKVIFDMDISGDCTNIGALATLHALQDLNEVEILSTTVGFHSPFVAGCADAVNLYYGRQLPVGTLHSKEEPTQFRYFADKLCHEVNTRYPEGSVTEDAVRVQRRALSNAEDHSVVFAVTGLLSTPAALLDSAADDISPLSGRQLIEKKIIRTIVMAGQNSSTFGDNPFCEYNIFLDVPAARHFCKEWPGEVIFSSFEIGIRVPSLANFAQTGDKDSPVRRAYELLREHSGESQANPFASWDATVSLLVARPDAGYFNLHEYGRMVVNDDGITEWHEEKDGKQTYLLPNPDMSFEKIGEIITKLVMATPKNKRADIMKHCD